MGQTIPIACLMWVDCLSCAGSTNTRARQTQMSRPETTYSQRGSYLGIPGVSQRVRRGETGTRPPAQVPVHAFREERARALDPSQPTGIVPLNLGPTLGIPGRASTPSLLAAYLCIEPGSSLATDFVASTEMYLVISGEGCSRWGNEEMP